MTSKLVTDLKKIDSQLVAKALGLRTKIPSD